MGSVESRVQSRSGSEERSRSRSAGEELEWRWEVDDLARMQRRRLGQGELSIAQSSRLDFLVGGCCGVRYMPGRGGLKVKLRRRVSRTRTGTRTREKAGHDR